MDNITPMPTPATEAEDKLPIPGSPDDFKLAEVALLWEQVWKTEAETAFIKEQTALLRDERILMDLERLRKDSE